jgi:hypothetical protein
MNRIKNSESGFAFIAAIIIVSVMVMAFMFAATRYFATFTDEAGRTRRLLAATEVAQNLAVEIRRGFDQRQLGTCTVASDAVTINTYDYCLPANVCVANPLASLDSGSTADQICWSRTTFQGSVASSRPASFFEKYLQASWYKALYKTGEKVVQLGALLSNQAVAQSGQEAYLPVLPGAPGPAVMMSNLDCTVADKQHCMKCEAAGGDWGGDGTLKNPCVLLNICMIPAASGGCPNESYRIRQWIGLEYMNP